MRIHRRPATWTAFLLFPALLLMPIVDLSAEEASSRTSTETVSVSRGPLGATIKAKGQLVPLRHESVASEPESYRGPLKIAETAKEGRVVEGQVLVRFEEEDYVEELAERERGLQAARNRLERQVHDFRLREREAALAMDDAIRKKQQADQALERYLGFERKAKEQEAVLGYQGAVDRIKDQQEELEQLEKMYNEDDLTEETEEIVLNRARRSLERALKYHAFRKSRHDYDMEVLLPRVHEDLRIRQRRATTTLERLQATQPLDMQKAEMDLAKAKRDFEKAEKELETFRSDRSQLILKAPMAGYAVAATLKGGSWDGLGSLASTLAPGKTVKRGQVLFTVVDDAVLDVHTSIKEADLLHVADGGPASVRTALTGKDVFEAKIDQVARYGAGGTHAVVLRILSKDKRLRAGLACTVELPKADNEDVLSVPAASVHEEDGTAYVFVRDGDGTVTKTKVTLGEKAAGRVEIVEGVPAGTRVLKTPPSSEKETAKK